jgi:sec-independent protein translocase protein TatB
MFDIGWQELALAAVIALLVIGPKDLPTAMHTLGRWVRYARGVGRELRQGIDELAREAELDDLNKDVQSLRASGSPRNILNDKVLDTMDSDHGLRDALDDSEIRDQVAALRRDVESAASGGDEEAETPAAEPAASGGETKRDT